MVKRRPAGGYRELSEKKRVRLISAGVKITTICENRTPRAGLLGEHGLALLLEVKGQRILFDTGAGATLMDNAEALGVDLGRVDAVFLSHGHYDHTGGLKTLLKLNSFATLPLYAHPDIFARKYIFREGKAPGYIGIPWLRAELEALGAEFHLNRGPLLLGEGLWATGEIPRSSQTKPVKPLFLLKDGDSFTEDPLYDDQALVVESRAGLIVLLGCAHAGLIDTLKHILSVTGRSRIYAVLGGTHLLNMPDDRLSRTIAALRQLGLALIAPCHCSGIRATAALHQAFGKRCLEHQVGSIFKLPL